MSELADRIHYVRKEKNLSQNAFADELNLSQNFVWMMESGKRSPSDRTISDICRIFGVDEVWLRTGDGQPFSDTPDEDEMVAALSQAMGGKPSTAKLRLIRAIAKMPEAYFPAIEQLLTALAKELPPPPEA